MGDGAGHLMAQKFSLPKTRRQGFRRENGQVGRYTQVLFAWYLRGLVAVLLFVGILSLLKLRKLKGGGEGSP